MIEINVSNIKFFYSNKQTAMSLVNLPLIF